MIELRIEQISQILVIHYNSRSDKLYQRQLDQPVRSSRSAWLDQLLTDQPNSRSASADQPFTHLDQRL